MFSEDQNMPTQETFWSIVSTGCTLDLSDYYGLIVPVPLIKKLAREAHRVGGHLIISGVHIPAAELQEIAKLGQQNLTVRFTT